MGPRRLFAWDGTEPIGMFEERVGGVGFSYSANYSGAPISLGMPVTGTWPAQAAERFLESRLPEGAGRINDMRMALGAASSSPFDLLPLTDAVGGIVFTATEEPPCRPSLPLSPCSEDELEGRIAAMSRHDGESWWPEDKPHVRFSLAGSQGKFSLAWVRPKWHWPSAYLPSTHIFKPDSPRFKGSGRVEDASMDLASLTGAEVAGHGMLRVGNESCYFVKRFDRDVSGFLPRRLRTEELFYSLKLADIDKYGIEVREVVSLLREAGLDDEVAYEWVEQVMVNMSVGNCDAHMRNYSVFLDESPRMTPMYDVLNTMYWPELEDGFAIMVNGQRMACGEFRPSDWEAEARTCGLDADRLSSEAVRIARSAVESLDVVLPSLPESMRDDFAKGVREANRGMLG